MFGSDPLSYIPQQRPQFVAPDPPPTPPSPSDGMFGHHKISIDLSRAIAGYLAGIGNPAGVQALQALNEMRDRQQAARDAAAQHQQQIQDEMSVHAANRNYDITHAPPPDIQDRIDVLNKIDPNLGATYARNYAANGGGMGPILTNPLTGQQMMPAGKAPPQSPPGEAIQRLRSNPAEAPQFDEIFGPGSAAKVLGGPTQPASGGFPY